jgi:alkylation response protein AidB-like acyl-CoA dehydrogenase
MTSFEHEERLFMETIRTLPDDTIRSILWRFSERFDLQMLIQSVRAVARGPVAQAVANGVRNTHEWTDEKHALLKAFDESGITSLFMDPEYGGYIEGPKNLALALTAFELSWVDGGAATSSLAGNLALEPIHERGTPEQKQTYMGGAVPPAPGDNRKQYRGAFGLTEPLPYVGVETGMLSGKVRIAEWNDSKEPVLQVDKRGRFITNMDFANFVCVAVESDDDRIKGSCMIILEEDDPGLYDRGAPTLKLVHQLSSTRDPIFSMQVPAHRIIGGYTLRDGVIIPNYNHSEVIDAVFKRTRVTVGLMTAAKLLSAIEPIIRYQRSRFRGGTLEPGSPRYDLGIQQKDDAIHRLCSIWAMGEAAASLGFAAARIFDDLQPLETEKDQLFREQGVERGRPELKALMTIQKQALELIELEDTDDTSERRHELESDPLVQFVLQDAVANVLCPATKLWNTGQGATEMREAVSLMGGYGITEDCPGFLGQKWMDSQLEATYEGPEAVQRRQLTFTMTTPVFQARLRQWAKQLETIQNQEPETGAGLVATGIDLWFATLDALKSQKDEKGKLFSSSRQSVTFPLTDALSWLLASYHQIIDIQELATTGPQNPALSEGLEGTLRFLRDLAGIQAARAVGEVRRICNDLYHAYIDESDTLDTYYREIDKALAGMGPVRDRAASSITQIMIPEILDYPA